MGTARILHVAAVEFTVKNLLASQLTYLKGQGFEVHIACAPDAPHFSIDAMGFNPASVTFPRNFRLDRMVAAGSDLRRLIKKLRPQIVHFHSPAAALPGRLFGLPKRHPRIVYTVHGFLHQWDNMTLRDTVLARLEQLLAWRTDLMLFQSREDLAASQEHGFGSDLRYLGNGVEDVYFSGPRGQRDTATPRRFLYVGRLSREKGILDLLEAWRSLPEAELTVVGDELPSDRDPISAQARHLVRGAGMAARVSFRGMLDGPSVRAELARADVFILPSWREGLPRSVIEAMASGLPVVATDIRGCRELVVPGENGWLVPPRQPAVLEAVLREVSAAPAARLRQMGAASFRRASSEYRESQVFQRLDAAYSDVLRK